MNTLNMKKVSGLRKILTGGAMGLATLAGSLYDAGKADAGIIQWRNGVPAAQSNPIDNPDNIGYFTSIYEEGNGGTINYDEGTDMLLDTTEVLNEKFFVTYVDHGDNKVQRDFNQDLLPGESYKTLLTFEKNDGATDTGIENTIEFLQADGNFTYDLKVDKNGFGGFDYFDSGSVSIGELTPWFQSLAAGMDYRVKGWPGMPNGFYYGELTITAIDADFDSDGDVDGSDFLAWQRGLGTLYDASHLAAWESQYGNSTPAIQALNSYSSNGGIPEPSSIVLAAIAAGSLLMAGRRNRKKGTN